jgi:hypothetical protein
MPKAGKNSGQVDTSAESLLKEAGRSLLGQNYAELWSTDMFKNHISTSDKHWP